MFFRDGRRVLVSRQISLQGPEGVFCTSPQVQELDAHVLRARVRLALHRGHEGAQWAITAIEPGAARTSHYEYRLAAPMSYPLHRLVGAVGRACAFYLAV